MALTWLIPYSRIEIPLGDTMIALQCRQECRITLVNFEGSHDDSIYCTYASSLLRGASQKKEIDKLWLQADAGKRIISIAYTYYIIYGGCSTVFRTITNTTSPKGKADGATYNYNDARLQRYGGTTQHSWD